MGDARYGPLGGLVGSRAGLDLRRVELKSPWDLSCVRLVSMRSTYSWKLVGLMNAWHGLCKLLAVIADASREAC